MLNGEFCMPLSRSGVGFRMNLRGFGGVGTNASHAAGQLHTVIMITLGISSHYIDCKDHSGPGLHCDSGHFAHPQLDQAVERATATGGAGRTTCTAGNAPKPRQSSEHPRNSCAR